MDKIDPGPGYRLLKADELVQMGDEKFYGGNWWPVEDMPPPAIDVGSRFRTGIRRKLPTAQQEPTSPEAPRDTLLDTLLDAKILDNDASDSRFLQWIADRLVHVHKDPEDVDFVRRLRTLASSLPDIPRPFTRNKYTRDLKALDGRVVPVDVYGVLAAFPTGSAAVDHAIKKLLAPGQRGHKDRLQDLKEARASLDRAIQMEEG